MPETTDYRQLVTLNNNQYILLLFIAQQR